MLFVLAWLVARPGAALACAACYGDPDSSMSTGLTWAISVLVGVVACVLAGVVTFFVRTVRHGEVVTEPADGADSETKDI